MAKVTIQVNDVVKIAPCSGFKARYGTVRGTRKVGKQTWFTVRVFGSNGECSFEPKLLSKVVKPSPSMLLRARLHNAETKSQRDQRLLEACYN